MQAPSALIWDGVDRLIDTAPGLRHLQSHGLHLLAARRWRVHSRPVPSDLAVAELWAAFRAHEARRVLERIRGSLVGPMILIKGPAAAAHYPEPSLRPFLDLDLLVYDPDEAQAALIGSGFEPVRSKLHPDTVHHLHPLQLPGTPLTVELHRHPKWIDGLTVPAFEELVVGAEESIGVEGVLALRPPQHALVLTAHLWAHDPLSRLLRVLDVAVTAEAADARELERLVDLWGMERVWRLTTRVADALFRGAEPPFPLRTWARGLQQAREPSVVEMHAGRCLAPFSVDPFPRAVLAFGAALAGLLRPQPYESWSSKVGRTMRQLRAPSMPRSEHAREVAATLHGAPHEGGPTRPEVVNESPQGRLSAAWRDLRKPFPAAVKAEQQAAIWAAASSSIAWLAISSAWAAAAVLTLALGGGLVRVPTTLGFVLVCPGLAVVRTIGLRSVAASLSVAIALSAALVVLVPAALLYAHVWSPVAALAILVCITLSASVTEVVLRVRHVLRGVAR